MKQVDMSPEAVTRRLKRLDQLWELCVSLMKAEKVSGETSKEKTKKDDRSEKK
jgi:hypothetical protein